MPPRTRRHLEIACALGDHLSTSSFPRSTKHELQRVTAHQTWATMVATTVGARILNHSWWLQPRLFAHVCSSSPGRPKIYTPGSSACPPSHDRRAVGQELAASAAPTRDTGPNLRSSSVSKTTLHLIYLQLVSSDLVGADQPILHFRATRLLLKLSSRNHRPISRRVGPAMG